MNFNEGLLYKKDKHNYLTFLHFINKINNLNGLFSTYFCKDQRFRQQIWKIVYIGVSFLSIPLSDESVPIIIRYLACIFPQVALKYKLE